MPKGIEKKLRSQFAAKGKSGKALDHAVYGTLNKIGAMHGSKETAAGARMETKFEKDHAQRNTETPTTETTSSTYNWRNHMGRPKKGRWAR